MDSDLSAISVATRKPKKRISKRRKSKRRISPNGGLRAPVDRVERWSIDKLIPYAKNPRLHSADQIAQIVASMREFGQTQLIVVDEKGEIIAGHGRVLAAETLGWKRVMVGVAIGWTETQKKTYRIADNKIALESTWDNELLKLEMEDLRDFESDLTLTGFDDKELSTLFGDEAGLLSASPQLVGLSYAVIVRCKDEADQTETLADLMKRGLNCEALIS